MVYRPRGTRLSIMALAPFLFRIVVFMRLFLREFRKQFSAIKDTGILCIIFTINGKIVH